AAFAKAVGERAREERQHEHRRELQRAHEPETERGVGQLEHQPRLRDRLHPRPDERDELAREEEAEIAMTERAHGGRQPRVGRHAGSLLLGGPRHGPPNPPTFGAPRETSRTSLSEHAPERDDVGPPAALEGRLALAADAAEAVTLVQPQRRLVVRDDARDHRVMIARARVLDQRVEDEATDALAAPAGLDLG